MSRETEMDSKIQSLRKQIAQIGSMSIMDRAKRTRLERNIHPFVETPILKITTEC